MQNYEDAPVFVQDFLIYMETIKGRSAKTVQAYYTDIRTLLRYMKIRRGLAKMDEFSELSINDVDLPLIQSITLHDLYAFLSFTSRELLNGANARARKVSCIKSFFKYLNTKANVLDENVAKDLDAPKLAKSLPKYLSLEESTNLLNSVDGSFKERDYCMLTLFLNCGLRVSELVGINLQDIKTDTLTVIGKGNKERTVYLNEACQQAVADYLKVRPKDGIKAQDRSALFISRNKRRINVRSVQMAIERHMKQAGIDTSKYSVHKLRHTAATLMYQYGHVDIRLLQEILGHTNLSTTEIYTHVDDAQLRAATDKNPLAHMKRTESGPSGTIPDESA